MKVLCKSKVKSNVFRTRQDRALTSLIFLRASPQTRSLFKSCSGGCALLKEEMKEGEEPSQFSAQAAFRKGTGM